MDNFFNKIRAIKDALFGKKEIHEGKSSADLSLEATREESSLQPQERAAYYIQIGFDFGTSFSKCVYREVTKNKAWIFCSDNLDTEYPFLIPSIVIYNDGVFRRHTNMESQYPQNGLFHLKFAIERIACNDIQAAVLSRYKKAAASDSVIELGEFIELCAVFFLASSFATIIKNIKRRFSDFERHPDDQLAVNMAIPVADASQENISSYYKKILKAAWAVSQHFEDKDSISLNELEYLIRESDLNNVQDELCAVYPEVSANVQAFIRSPASSPDLRTIYFFSDTGAGTVDQSVFTYNDKLNYFAAEVLPLGSGHIDLKACGNEITLERMEYWRKNKESGSNHIALINAKQSIEDLLKKESYGKTLMETKKRLPTGDGVNPITTLQEHARLIFGGGGHSSVPYESGVVKAFNQFFNASAQPDITSIQTPTDLEMNGHGESWMRRLFVAYGLSFPTVELAKNSYPNQNTLEAAPPPKHSWKACTCRGINPDCLQCYGRGWCD